MAVYEAWKKRAETALDACRRLGGEADPLTIKPPATPDEINKVEKELGLGLPASFRRVLTAFASAFELSWFLPDGTEPPDPVSGIFSGCLSWDPKKLAELEKGRLDSTRVCYPNPEDEYDHRAVGPDLLAVFHPELSRLEDHQLVDGLPGLGLHPLAQRMSLVSMAQSSLPKPSTRGSTSALASLPKTAISTAATASTSSPRATV